MPGRPAAAKLLAAHKKSFRYAPNGSCPTSQPGQIPLTNCCPSRLTLAIADVAGNETKDGVCECPLTP